MFKSVTFRLALISTLFTLSTLAVLPRIPIYISGFLLKLDSYVGGYEFGIFGKNINLKDLNMGIGMGNSTAIIYDTQPETTSDSLGKLEITKDLIQKRLDILGYVNYKLSIGENDGKYFLLLEVPKSSDASSISYVATGSGDLSFKKLKDPSSWNPQDAQKIVSDASLWEDSGISRSDFQDVVVTRDTSGRDVLQVKMTAEGKVKFNKLARENLDKPVAIYVNNTEQPFTVPIMSEDLANNPDADPMISGIFPDIFVKSFLVQYKNGPLPVVFSQLKTTELPPIYGAYFLENFFKSFLIGLALLSFITITKYRKRGALFITAFLSSLVLFGAMFKLFSLTVDIAAFAGFLVTFVFLVEEGSAVLSELQSKSSEEKPFNIILYDVFAKREENLKYFAILLFFTMLVVSKSSGLATRTFVYAILLSIISLYHCNYVFKNALDIFGGGKNAK